MIKLIGVDIDGTIMKRGNKINFAVVEALKKAREQGIRVTVASGRNIKKMKSVVEKLGLEASTPLIAQNGAQVFSFNPDGSFEFAYQVFFSKEESDLLFEIANKHNVKVFGYTNDEDIAYVNKKFSPVVFVLARHTQRKVFLYDFKSPLKASVSKLIVIGSRKNMIFFRWEVESYGFPVFAFSYVTEARHNVEVVPKGVNKSEGLKFVANMFGIDQKETMYFGDGENDLDAIKWAGVGVAMGNAPALVKKEADLVTDTIKKNGVARQIEKLLKSNR